MKDAFVPNSTDMNMQNDRLIILTGPNMAGEKHIYAPSCADNTDGTFRVIRSRAKAANICITDRIFTRVGRVGQSFNGPEHIHG